MARGGVREQLEHRERGHRLPGAGFADQRHGLPLLDVEGDAIDRERLARPLPEGGGQLLDLEQPVVGRFHPSYPKVLRGSNASRTASPMKMSSESMVATVKNPEMPSHGAWMLALPCESISPSDGEPGGRPKPRKSSAVSVITEEERMNGKNVMVATMALGKRWRNMMVRFDTPSARAAWMYSKLRPRRNSARTSPTSDTQENNSRIPSSTKKPGTRTDEMMSSR